MPRTVPRRFVGSPGRMRRACRFATAAALGLAFSASAAGANPDYPPGLFENSPVVPHGYMPPETPPPGTPGDFAPPGADSGLQPPDMGPGPAPDDFAPPPGPYGAAPGPYGAAPAYPQPPVGPYDAAFCASVGARTFHSLEEVRQAHARCDRAAAAPQPYHLPPY